VVGERLDLAAQIIRKVVEVLLLAGGHRLEHAPQRLGIETAVLLPAVLRARLAGLALLPLGALLAALALLPALAPLALLPLLTLLAPRLLGAGLVAGVQLALLALLPPLGALARLLQAALDAAPLGLEDLLELLADVLQHVVELELVELLLALLAQALEELLQAHHAVAGAVLEAGLHHPLQRAADVPVGEQVVGELLHQLFRVERRELLRAVPARVAIEAHYHTSPTSSH